jgi:hypothetical protein
MLFKDKEDSGIFLSKVATSLENLFKILPSGFSSKNYAFLKINLNCKNS